MKAYFLQRVSAYLIDAMIIALLLFLVRGVIPVGNNYKELTDKSKEIVEKSVGDGLSLREVYEENAKINYELAKTTYMWSVATVIIYLGYFVCYQSYANGQTIGKKLMKIMIKKRDDSELSYNDSLKRMILLHGLLFNIATLILVLVLKSKQYVPIAIGLEFLSVAIFFVIIMMVIFRKDGRGMHDIFANTEVIICEDVLPETIVLKEVPLGPVEDAVVLEKEEDDEEEKKGPKDIKRKKGKPKVTK